MNDDDEDDEKFRMMPLGDMGIIGIAFVFLGAFLWMLFNPTFVTAMVSAMEKTSASSQPPSQSQSNPGEVPVDLTPLPVGVPAAKPKPKN